jgi:hypothetical protein
VDNAISTLAYTASANDEYNKEIFPYLLNHLAGCRPKEVPQHAEKTMPSVNASNKADFIKILEKRMESVACQEGHQTSLQFLVSNSPFLQCSTLPS